VSFGQVSWGKFFEAGFFETTVAAFFAAGTV
jgi:hypothetical protein